MFGPAAALLVFLTDRVLKALALSAHGEGAFVFTPTPKFLVWGFKTTLNPGAVFGIPIPTSAIVTVSVLVMASVIAFALYNRAPLKTAGAAFIFFGGFSNLLDRIRLGAVVDIFSIGLATFNVSDMMIVLGAMLLLRSHRQKLSLPK